MRGKNESLSIIRTSCTVQPTEIKSPKLKIMHLKLYVHIPIPARPGVSTINAQHDIREIHFNPSTVVRDALEQIRTQYNLPDDTEHTRYGLFMMNDDNGQFTDEDRYEKGWWLNDESPLDNYLLKAEDNILIKESDFNI